MTYDEMMQERDKRTADRMKQIVAAGRTTTEMFKALGLRGTPGFMGRGTFGSGLRTAGYARSGR